MLIDVLSNGFFIWQRALVSTGANATFARKCSVYSDDVKGVEMVKSFSKKIAYSLFPSLSKLRLYDRDEVTLGLDNYHEFFSNPNCYRPR